MSSQYPRDEFDQVTDQGPVGVHRQQRSPWQTVLPFLVALLLVPLLAWGATTLIKGRGHDAPASAGETTQSQVESAQSEVAIDPGQSSTGGTTDTGGTPIPPAQEEGPTGAPDDPNNPEVTTPPTDGGGTEVAPPDATVDLALPITVYNVSGIEGLAGSNVARLAEQGFTGATAENLESTGQSENTIFYTDASQQVTAAKVAEILGITNVLENAEATGGNGLAVVLLTQN